MKYLNKVFVTVILTTALTSCSGGGSSNTEESYVSGDGSVTFINPSDRIDAPAMAGMTLTGTNYAYTIGQVTVVNVWASWCSPCRSEIPTLIDLSKKYTQVTFLGVLTRDMPPAAEAFARRFAIPYPTLIDDSILLGFRDSLPANSIPSTAVIDKNGKVAGRILGEVTVASLSKLIERVSSE
jgi:thiol-disulfide isomerase/thioredoxin